MLLWKTICRITILRFGIFFNIDLICVYFKLLFIINLRHFSLKLNWNKRFSITRAVVPCFILVFLIHCHCSYAHVFLVIGDSRHCFKKPPGWFPSYKWQTKKNPHQTLYISTSRFSIWLHPRKSFFKNVINHQIYYTILHINPKYFLQYRTSSNEGPRSSPRVVGHMERALINLWLINKLI